MNKIFIICILLTHSIFADDSPEKLKGEPETADIKYEQEHFTNKTVGRSVAQPDDRYMPFLVPSTCVPTRQDSNRRKYE